MAKAGGKNKTSPSQTSKMPSPMADVTDGGSVEKIRDILFGNQIKDFQNRFSKLEDRLVKAHKDLREETHKRLEALELFFKNEQNAIKDLVISEVKQLESEDKKIQNDLNTTVSSLKKNLNRAEEKFLKLTSDLRQQILDQSKALSTDIQQNKEQTTENLRDTANGLEEAKIDRTTLAEYLIDMAMRISDHEGVPVEKN